MPFDSNNAGRRSGSQSMVTLFCRDGCFFRVNGLEQEYERSVQKYDTVDLFFESSEVKTWKTVSISDKMDLRAGPTVMRQSKTYIASLLIAGNGRSTQSQVRMLRALREENEEEEQEFVRKRRKWSLFRIVGGDGR